MDNETVIKGGSNSNGYFEWLQNNSYFVTLISIIVGCIIYRLLFETIEKTSIPINLYNYYNTIIDNGKYLLGKLWLKTYLKGNAMSVNVNNDTGILDKIMEDINVSQI